MVKIHRSRECRFPTRQGRDRPLQDRAPPARQQAPFRIGAAFLPVWHCTPQLGSLTVSWSGEVRLEGASSLTAKVGSYFLTPEGQKHKHGLMQKRSKGQWAMRAILATHRGNLSDGLRPTKLLGPVNAYLSKQPDYDLGVVNKMMIGRALNRLYALRTQGRLGKSFVTEKVICYGTRIRSRDATIPAR